MEYNLSKTAIKTSKENDLVLLKENGRTYLHDFSKLENLGLDDYITQIKIELLKNNLISFRTRFLSIDLNNFEALRGHIIIRPIKVYDKKGKLLYTIMDIAAIKLGVNERETTYKEWEICKEIKEKYYEIDEIEEIEI